MHRRLSLLQESESEWDAARGDQAATTRRQLFPNISCPVTTLLIYSVKLHSMHCWCFSKTRSVFRYSYPCGPNNDKSSKGGLIGTLPSERYVVKSYWSWDDHNLSNLVRYSCVQSQWDTGSEWRRWISLVASLHLPHLQSYPCLLKNLNSIHPRR